MDEIKCDKKIYKITIQIEALSEEQIMVTEIEELIKNKDKMRIRGIECEIRAIDFERK